MSDLLYAERDIEKLDYAGNYYCKHVSAMTSERLHRKSAIAAELGYRDMKLERVRILLDQIIDDGSCEIGIQTMACMALDIIDDAID